MVNFILIVFPFCFKLFRLKIVLVDWIRTKTFFTSNKTSKNYHIIVLFWSWIYITWMTVYRRWLKKSWFYFWPWILDEIKLINLITIFLGIKFSSVQIHATLKNNTGMLTSRTRMHLLRISIYFFPFILNIFLVI